MNLPADFQFSQASLQDYVDCRRRFQLRYVERVAWPAVEAEPALENERHLRLGAAFHRLVHQHQMGVPAERLSASATDPDLRRWWESYLRHRPADLPPRRYPEIVLSALLAGHRMVAKFDLLAVAPGERAVVIDWKTSRRRSPRAWLAGRLQTRVYPYLLVRAGRHLNGGYEIDPDHVEMIYWFANAPTDPEHFTYSVTQYEQDTADLTALIEEIAALDGDDAHPTDDERRCNYCRYRSLCRRGVRAGDLDAADEVPEPEPAVEIDFDLEQIAEIEY
jgi:CRISPR/Cas system-associated exonuclease Cas4 (RecB family)